jgi:hypothetical protein
MIRGVLAFLVAVGLGLALEARAQPVHDKAKRDAAQKTITKKLGDRAAGVCPLLDKIALKAGLPPLFFARLIWQESRFRANAVSPKGAQGIAQFMPGTADMRGLADPFEPKSALVASAAFLADLHKEFGNLGLAAAAYNAGPQRVRNWLSNDLVMLPAETRKYVAIITGRLPQDWRNGASGNDESGAAREPVTPDESACARLVQVLENGAPDLETAPPAPWGVQVAGHFSKAKTIAQFRRVQRRFNSIIGEQKPIIRRERNLSLGRRPTYQARLGAQSRREARQLCDRLRAAGGVCIVLRN